MPGVRKEAAKHSPFKAACHVHDASFTIGAESASRTINIQLKDANGDDLSVKGFVRAYLAADANGNGLAAAAPSGGVAAGTDGLLLKGNGTGAITALTNSTAVSPDNTIANVEAAAAATASAITLLDTEIDGTPDATAANLKINTGIDITAASIITNVNVAIQVIENNLSDLAAKVNELLVSDRQFTLVSEDDGDIDLVITEAGTATFYLALLMPDGRVVVSDAITFAA